jgi:hypothetical protein
MRADHVLDRPFIGMFYLQGWMLDTDEEKVRYR